MQPQQHCPEKLRPTVENENSVIKYHGKENKAFFLTTNGKAIASSQIAGPVASHLFAKNLIPQSKVLSQAKDFGNLLYLATDNWEKRVEFQKKN